MYNGNELITEQGNEITRLGKGLVTLNISRAQDMATYDSKEDEHKIKVAELKEEYQEL